ncbi:glycerate kinase type-2 family protein [Lachnoclostridium phytofermentans]|uniref:Hydroxypyruvate reductase n=1 Tax=Lachnoclostridium phytofermentans (strain ATCC 700394 / DSM 18823 / ISDg) TaxID=357809 RepID=A9KJ57_LACP7|nr:glycerate kinase [Lachnoclostridium phytofermentans]ABX42469.1 Hydroxypyruvate reductase [Lachnoclostridium phytofermentans ISDg]
MNIRNDAQLIIDAAIKAALPDNAVKKALEGHGFSDGKLLLIAIGKAAWSMAKTACEILSDRIDDGVVITKYDHAKGNLPHVRIYEAGHPVPDANSFKATEEAIKLVQGLTSEDTVLFLISGGGSALFEKPLIPNEMLENLTKELLASGANIVEMNTIRKRLSAVKGGKFAKLCEPAKVFSVVLSDIIGDPLDMIASGPAYPDNSTSEQAREILKRYGLTVSKEINELLSIEPIHELNNVTTEITGSVSQLCEAAKRKCEELGYEPIVLTSSLSCEAREAGSFLASIAQHYNNTEKSLAFIAGGETVVHLKGNGLGGRNQELVLASAVGIAGLQDVAIFSIGSDGTDGPTDAAGGYVDTNTQRALEERGISIFDTLEQNNAYYALQACDGLIMTGPTGTNVNDLSVLLIKR